MKVSTITKSLILAVTIVLTSFITVSAQEKQSDQQVVPSEMSIKLSSELFHNTSVSAFKNNSFLGPEYFLKSKAISAGMEGFYEASFDFQQILSDEDLLKSPLQRPATVVPILCPTGLSNIGGQTFYNYKLGKMNMTHINTFDWNGTLSNSTVEFSF